MKSESTLTNDYYEIKHSIQINESIQSNRPGWALRIFTPLTLVAVIVVQMVLGMDSSKEISDEFHLYVTPPDEYFLIWIVIYFALIVANIYNLFSNLWSIKVHLFYIILNCFNIIWVIVYSIGSLTAVIISSFLHLPISILLLFTWI